MKLKNSITYNSLILLSNLGQSLKPETQYHYANKLSYFCYRFLKIRQKEARKNISIAFPNKSDRVRENILKDSFLNFFFFLTITAKKNGIKIKNTVSHLEKASETGGTYSTPPLATIILEAIKIG